LKTKHYTIPIFIPELACPFRCIFCNQQKISGKVKIPQPDEISEIIESYLATIPKRKRNVEIGFFGGNFTGIDLELQENYLAVANEYLNRGDVHGIRLSTRPDYINTKVLKLLKKQGVSTIELGAQSMDDDVLMAAGRGHKVADTLHAATMIKKLNFHLGLQMMIGLPGDTLEKSMHTAQQIVELGADNTRIYPALVIRGTPLENLYRTEKYSPLPLEEAVRWLKEIYKIFEVGRVAVIRMGLHPSEGLISGEELIAGPFHESLRELVLTELWWESLQYLVLKKRLGKLNIFVHPTQFNYAIGYAAKNKKRLLEHFEYVVFQKDESLKGRDFQVNEY